MLIVFTCIYIGCMCLAFAMDKHYKEIWKNKLPIKHKQAFKAAGWLMLIASAFIAFEIYGYAMGSVYWVGLATFAGFGFAMLMSYQQKCLFHVPAALILISGLAAAL